jgi:hypothetical protein
MQHVLSQSQTVTREQAEATVLPHVQDAIEKLLYYGVPYLEEFVNTKRKQLMRTSAVTCQNCENHSMLCGSNAN